MQPWLVPFLLVTTSLNLITSVLTLSHGQVMTSLISVFNTLFFGLFLVGAWQEAKQRKRQSTSSTEERPAP
ncbi:hypothetical protein ACFWTE_07110 [Nocardiopsis sp. NPDC058631]|uniref:hypothetical protein n=1 Tax=Nocardiopsis sp. NPDC058631 TaxID=3346566 RepID=UPI0036490D29